MGDVYWITNGQGQVLLHRRPDKGMLGGMVGLPTSEWVKKKTMPVRPGFLGEVEDMAVSIHHSFTHFDLELALKKAELKSYDSKAYFWQDIKGLDPEHFPTLFKKALNFFLKEAA